MDDRLMMDTEEDAAYVFEREEDIMESEEEGEEEEEEEAEQLEEMKPPVFTSLIGSDGIRVDRIMCIDDGIIRFKNRCQLDNCSICYQPPSTTHPKHQICCLPCGHMYGFSCIKRWLLQSSSSGKCPQCNSLCTIQDAILLYPPPLCVTAHQQQASLAAFFPLTQQGFLEFKEYETSRALDAVVLQDHDLTHFNILVRKHNDLVLRAHELARQSDNLLAQAVELEDRPDPLGLADVFRRRASLLKPRIDSLRRRTHALKRLASALRRRSDAFGQRSDAYRSRLKLFVRMCREHGMTKKDNNGPCTTCMVKKDKRKMQASGTVEVPKEEPVEDVAEEHEEEEVQEKVEEKAKPTKRPRASRSNKGKGPDSISKVILKRK